MAVLGAIIAGGQSRRFGSDKAAFVIDGCALIEHTHAALASQVDRIVLCGRSWSNWQQVTDLPEAGLGPLGGLAGALCYASERGFSQVLSVPVDTYPLPHDLTDRLQPAPSAFSRQYLIGLWPAALADVLALHLAAGHRSVRSWLAACDCRMVDDGALNLRNFNRPDEL